MNNIELNIYQSWLKSFTFVILRSTKTGTWPFPQLSMWPSDLLTINMVSIVISEALHVLSALLFWCLLLVFSFQFSVSPLSNINENLYSTAESHIHIIPAPHPSEPQSQWEWGSGLIFILGTDVDLWAVLCSLLYPMVPQLSCYLEHLRVCLFYKAKLSWAFNEGLVLARGANGE